MTNLRSAPHHNIYGLSAEASIRCSDVALTLCRRSEAGYTLVALLALMTVLALFAMAVAPSFQHQAIREREREAIFRGEQVADAITAYYRNRSNLLRTTGDQALPSSMDQLLEGVPIPGGAKNRQILRVSASRDPLSADGEWRLIHPRSTALVDFQSAVMLYSGNVVPVPRDPQVQRLQQFAAPQITSILNLGATGSSSATSVTTDDSSGPFVGVATRNSGASVMSYYGIEQHEQWIFTPLFRN